jgi:hypothetical protein
MGTAGLIPIAFPCHACNKHVMLNPSDINATIATREAEVERLRRDLEIAEAELRGMKELRDQILGTKVTESATDKAVLQGDAGRFNVTGSKAKGRQRGAISKEWRAILAKLYSLKGFDESMIINIAKDHDINLKHSNARLQMAVYKGHGYVEDINGHWKVTRFAAEKFGFLREATENEAPANELEGAS